ncbi:MAG: flippase-like domain-containing protein [Dehalococcoidia bacterium]|nr:flippase-like domain-containing protein [Dehalococcoidia bacterium]
MAIEGNAAAAPDPQRSGFARSRTFAILRVVATAAIVAALVYRLSPADIAGTVRHADVPLLLAALAAMLLTQALVVCKWTALLRARDVRLPLLLIARTYCVATLVGTVLPTAVGGDVYRVYRIQREPGVRAGDVTMSVLYERATGYAAMTCIGALGAAFSFGAAWVGVVALLGGGAAAGVVMLLLPRLPFPALRQGHALRNLIAHRGELIAVYQMVIFSLLIQVVYISSITLAGRAFGAHVSWWYWAFATWLVALAVLLPVTIGGLGLRESGYSALVRHAGATSAQGASTGFALGLLLVVTNALGLAAVTLWERRRGAAPAPAGRVEAPEPLRPEA